MRIFPHMEFKTTVLAHDECITTRNKLIWNLICKWPNDPKHRKL